MLYEYTRRILLLFEYTRRILLLYEYTRRILCLLTSQRGHRVGQICAARDDIEEQQPRKAWVESSLREITVVDENLAQMQGARSILGLARCGETYLVSFARPEQFHIRTSAMQLDSPHSLCPTIALP